VKLQFGGRLAAARDMPRFSIHTSPGFAVSAVTVFATLLMGMLDAFTFITQDHTFVTAQTGNLIMLTVNGLEGDYISAASHIIVFAGYFLGAFLGQWISDRITGNERHRLRVFLLIQTLFFIAVAATHQRLPDDILLFMLGLLAGYEIDLFRKMGAITINNGIMTGNAKNLATNLYQFLVLKNKTAGHTAGLLALTIAVFVLGIGAGTWLTQLSQTWAMWSFALISASQLLFTYLLWPVEERVE